jgi:hypothetical protein
MASKAPQWAPVSMPFWAGTRVGNCSSAVLMALARALFREEGTEQGQGGTGPQPLEQAAAGQIGLLIIEKSHIEIPLFQP